MGRRIIYLQEMLDISEGRQPEGVGRQAGFDDPACLPTLYVSNPACLPKYLEAFLPPVRARS